VSTAFDAFVPEGKPIHPLDLFELIDKSTAPEIVAVRNSPSPVDQDDYERNRHKSGEVIRVNGELYFETTTVTPRTTRFA
jgi:hypothetical protein